MAEKRRYIVVSSTDLSFLEQMINDRIKEGYRPHGDLVTAQEIGVSEITFFQPMILASVTPAAAKPPAKPAAAKKPA